MKWAISFLGMLLWSGYAFAQTAPSITTQPTDVIATVGQPVALSVTATGSQPLSYLWIKDGVILPSQTNSTLAFNAFQFTNCGSYNVVVRNAYGLAISFPASLSVSNAPLRVWGNNNSGQLGIGSLVSTNRPVLATNGVAAVAIGHNHSLFVQADGTLWAMGGNVHGQLGIGSYVNTNRPAFVTNNVVTVAAAGSSDDYDNHSLFVRADGTLWAMGSNLARELGIGGFTYTNRPVFVTNNVVAVAAGEGTFDGFSLYLLADGTLWGMGDNSYGQLGNGAPFAPPVPVQLATNVVTMAAGFGNFLFVTADETLWAVGNNYHGQLGIGTTIGTNWPVLVTNNVVAAANAGYFHGHSLFVKTDGTLWAAGNNSYGELGNGTTNDSTSPVFVTSNVVSVATGGSYHEGHSLFVKNDGTLWAMGNNSYGQLGIGNQMSTNLPVYVTNNVVAVAAGVGYNSDYSLFVKADGTLWGMGENYFGQLGNGNTSATSKPVKVATNVVTLAAGGGHSLFVKVDGTLWAMGANGSGQLGIGTNNSTLPLLVTNNVVAVATGGGHSLFVRSDGTLWGMGYNGYGQLGNGTTNNANQPVLITNSVVAATGGFRHSLFVKADGTLWAMGWNGFGENGNGTTVLTNRPVLVNGGGLLTASLARQSYSTFSSAIAVATPQIKGLTNIAISLRLPASFAPSISAGDSPVTFQWQLNGTNLPNATNAFYSIPSASTNDAGTYTLTVTGLYGSATASATLTILNSPGIISQPVNVVAGLRQSVSLSVTNGGLGPFSYQWIKDGAMLPGQTNTTLFFDVFQFTNCGSYNVVVSNAYGLAITYPTSLSITNAPLRAWGYNYSGQLGTGTTSNSTLPVVVASNVVAAAVGGAHSLFVKGDGTLWGMGLNSFGSLGSGTPSTTTRPWLITNNTAVPAVGNGFYGNHSLYVQADGTLWGMGDGFSSYPSYQRVLVTNNVVAVATGDSYYGGHTLFVRTDGTLWAMGQNSFGQLGIGTMSSASQPTPVTMATSNVVAVAAGVNYSLFVKADKTLWGMGYNGYGQLGIGNFADTNRPAFIASNVVAAVAGGVHSLFVKADGTLWAMGGNGSGQLGIGTTNVTSLPVLVTNDVVAAAGGYSHSLFVKADGSLWCMGYNGNGQLGIGTTNNSTVPVLVKGGGLLTASLAKQSVSSSSLAIAVATPQVLGLTDRAANLGESISLSPSVAGGDGSFTIQCQLFDLQRHHQRRWNLHADRLQYVWHCQCERYSHGAESSDHHRPTRRHGGGIGAAGQFERDQ